MDRRRKTYSAQSGYVYEYTYEGVRPCAGGVEYVFSVSSDRRTVVSTVVVLADDVIADWERDHEFTLRPNERYGIAKMALFQAFDERRDPARMRAPIQVRPADLELIIQTLGLI